jgi:hypothetical protein
MAGRRHRERGRAWRAVFAGGGIMNRARGVSVCAASARSLWLSKPSRSRRRKITARSCGSRFGARNAVPCGWSRVRPSEAKGCASAQHRSAFRHKRSYGLASTSRIFERGKMLNQFLHRHHHPPFVDEGRTSTPVRPSNPASPFHASPLVPDGLARFALWPDLAGASFNDRRDLPERRSVTCDRRIAAG